MLFSFTNLPTSNSWPLRASELGTSGTMPFKAAQLLNHERNFPKVLSSGMQEFTNCDSFLRNLGKCVFCNMLLKGIWNDFEFLR